MCHKILALILAFFISAMSHAAITGGVGIAYNHAKIDVDGALIVKDTGTGLHFQRFTDDILTRFDGSLFKSFYFDTKAKSLSGVVLRFTTSSPAVDIHFTEVEFQSRAPNLGVIQNGNNETLTEFAPGTHPGDYTLEVNSDDPGNPVTYEVTLPSWANCDFLGITLEAGYDLLDNPVEDKPIYAAFGDSISHGTGQQCKTYQTFPFLLAEANGWELYNFAIGGSTTTPELAQVLDPSIVSGTWDSKKPSVITVLWGFNDCNNTSFTRDEFVTRYTAFLNDLLTHAPNAEIFCIRTLITTDDDANNGAVSGKPVQDYRDMVESIVYSFQQAGNTNVHLINGHAFTKAEDLSDGVHLSPDGAAEFAAQLNTAINTVLSGSSPSGSLSTWLSGHGLSAGNEADDGDGDGVVNMFEYLMDEDPAAPISGKKSLTGTLNFLSHQLMLGFQSDHYILPDDVTYTLLGSDNLVDWSPVTYKTLVQYTGNGTWMHKFFQDSSLDSGGKPFIRLRISDD